MKSTGWIYYASLLFNDYRYFHLSRDKDQRQGGRSGEDSGRMHGERSFNGPLPSSSERASFDQKSTNGVTTIPSQSSGMSATIYKNYTCASLISVGSAMVQTIVARIELKSVVQTGLLRVCSVLTRVAGCLYSTGRISTRMFS